MKQRFASENWFLVECSHLVELSEAEEWAEVAWRGKLKPNQIQLNLEHRLRSWQCAQRGRGAHKPRHTLYRASAVFAHSSGSTLDSRSSWSLQTHSTRELRASAHKDAEFQPQETKIPLWPFQLVQKHKHTHSLAAWANGSLTEGSLQISCMIEAASGGLKGVAPNGAVMLISHTHRGRCARLLGVMSRTRLFLLQLHGKLLSAPVFGLDQEVSCSKKIRALVLRRY